MRFFNKRSQTSARHGARQKGFTLVQLSVILTLAALVIVAALPSFQANLTVGARTVVRMNKVLAALRQYQLANGTLPCPADGTQPTGSATYGVPALNPGSSGNCTGGSPAANYVDTINHAAIGMVPVKALNLTNDDALDGFGRVLTYAVDTNATALCWPSPSLAGGLLITDNGAVNNSVLVLVSHGADGHGAFLPLAGSSGTANRLNAGSTDVSQLTNAHVDTTFNPSYLPLLTNFIRKQPTSTFDDIILYRTPSWSFNSLPQGVQNVVTVTPPADGSYRAGQLLTFTVTFPAAPTVSGTPRLKVQLSSGTVYANYASTSGLTATFTYSLQTTDQASNGLSVLSPIDMNGGSITVSGTNACPAFFTPPLLGNVFVPTVYVGDTGNNRVQYFNADGTYENKFGTVGTGNTQFNGPTFTAVDSGGNLYVSDPGNNRVQKFNALGTYLVTFTGLTTPTGIAIDPNGTVWVADAGANHIYKFAATGGAPTGTYGSGGTGTNQVSAPAGLAVDGLGYIWVADKTNNRIQKMTTTGTFTAYTSGGTAFSAPQGIAVDSSNNVWVADTGNNLIQKFNNAGAYQTQYSAGSLNAPIEIAFDASNNLYIADSGNAKIQIWNNQGTPQTSFNSPSNLLSGPKGVAVAPSFAR